jgi:hypothetical protein
MDVQTADVDGDGRGDIIGRDGGQWWVSRSNGSSFVDQLWAQWADVNWLSAAVFDLNADGLADLIARNNGNWTVGLSDGDSFTGGSVWGNWSSSANWLDVLPGEFRRL